MAGTITFPGMGTVTEFDADYIAYADRRMGTLRRWAYTFCGDPHQADDLVQDTLTTVYAKWHRVSQTDNIDGYVHQILLRAFLTDRRRNWWKVRLHGDNLPERERPTAAAGIEEREWLRAALLRITPRQRTVLVLRFMCDLSVADVAVHLGCTEGTVKSRTLRALAALRRVLATDPSRT